MSDKKRADMTPDELERERKRGREYYWRNRERLLQQQREYYRKRGKEAHAERIKRYRHSDMERTRAKQREYRAANRERIRELDRRYRERNREKVLAAQRRYWYENRERLLEQRREHYRNNRYRLNRLTLDRYIMGTIERLSALCPEMASEYMERWPYEDYAAEQIKRQLWRMRLSPSHVLYDDCVEAGMLAYLYSIHRCAYMLYEHTERYILKMIRVLMYCALAAGSETEAICSEHNLLKFELDCDGASQLV